MKRVIAIILIFLLLLTGCSVKPKSFYTDGFFGTFTEAEYYGDDLTEKLDKKLSDLDSRLSVSDKNSYISRFNEIAFGERIEIDELTYLVLMKARELYEITNGYYDPTVYPLVDLWGFSARQKTENGKMPYDRAQNDDGSFPLPDEKYILAFKKLVGFDGIAFYLENGKYYLEKRIEGVTVDNVLYNAKIDLCGIVKGYACDMAKTLFDESGITSGFFSCGGSSMVILEKKDGGCYELAIKNPRKSDDFPEYTLLDTDVSSDFVSTSGDYENCYFVDGKRYSHIINPKTGYPVGIADGITACQLTLVGNGGCNLDGYSTALLCMGLEDARWFLDTLEIKYVEVFDNDGVISVETNLEGVRYKAVDLNK